MKKITTLLVLLVSLCQLNAQQIHWITFIDTTDKDVDALGVDHGVGQMDKNIRQILYGHWINTINAALAPKGYKSDIKDYYDERTTPENCKLVVENLQTKPEDIIVFYYVGHGARNINDPSQYPQMLLAQNDEKKCIPLEWVHKVLKSKPSRLVITIGMCCNVYDEVLSAKQGVSFSPNSGRAYAEINEVANIQKLFLENKGDIIISSSDKGQPSWGGEFKEIGEIDFFTYCLIANFGEEVMKSPEPSWDNLLANVQNDVNDLTLELSKRPKSKITEQIPIYDVYVEETDQPEFPDINDKEEEITTDPDKNEFLNDITNVLDLIISTRRMGADRIESAEFLKKYFADNAEIKIVGQDRDVVVDKETPESFFGRISFTKRLLKVIAVDIEVNNAGKIQTMKVKEHYLKSK